MEVRGSLEIAGSEKFAADPVDNLFTGRTYWNTVSSVLRLYANGIWNTVGAIAQASGTVKFDAVLNSDLDLSGITADTIKYGYLLYPTTTPDDVTRTITTPTVASGEFDQVSLKLFSYYYTSLTVQAPDGKLFRNPEGGTVSTLTIRSQEFVQIFYDPDIGAGEWIITESSEDDVSRINNTTYISANIDLTDYYITNTKTNQVSRFDIPVSIINESGSSGTEITLFNGTSTDLFIMSKQIAIYNPTNYTIDVTAFTAQTIKNNFTGVSQLTWTLAAGKYLILAKNTSQYEIVDTSDSAISQLSTGGGLSLVVLTGPLTQDLAWGNHYLLDSTGGSSTLTMPATSGLTTVQQEQAKLRIHDISLDWDTNPCTIIPPSGSSIRNGAIDEEWVLNSQDTWYLFSRTSDTTIAMEHPFTPQITDAGSGTGEGRVNLFSNGSFEGNSLDGWSSTKPAQLSLASSGSQIEGEYSLLVTSDGAGQVVSTTLTVSDDAYKSKLHGIEGTIDTPTTGALGDWKIRFKRNGTTIPGLEKDLNPGRNYLDGMTVVPGLDTISFEIEDIAASNLDECIADIFVLTPQGQGYVTGVSGPWENITGDITYPTLGFGTVTFETSQARDDGESREFNCFARAGAVTGDPFYVELDENVDVTKLSPLAGSTVYYMTDIDLHRVKNTAGEFNAANFYCKGYVNAAFPNRLYFSDQAVNASSLLAVNVNNVLSSNDGFVWKGSLPMVRLSGQAFQGLSKGAVLQNAKARFFRNGNQSISDSSTTTIILNDDTFNDMPNDIELDISTGIITFKTAGYYTIFGSFRFTAAFNAEIQNRLNPSSGNPTLGVGAGDSIRSPTFPCTDTFYFNAGDTFEWECFQDSGSARNIQGNDQTTYLTVYRNPDDTGNLAVGAGTSDEADENPRYLIPRNQRSGEGDLGTITSWATVDSKKYRWYVIGNMCFYEHRCESTTASSSTTALEVDLPLDVPAPKSFSNQNNSEFVTPGCSYRDPSVSGGILEAGNGIIFNNAGTNRINGYQVTAQATKLWIYTAFWQID